MSTENQNDPSMVVPLAAPLTGVNTQPDHPDISEVFPAGDAASGEHLVSKDDD